MRKLVCILIGLCSISSSLANDNQASVFSELQTQKSIENIELEIANLKLQNIHVKNEIDKLNGNLKSNSNSLDIRVQEILTFNNQSQAVIAVDNISKTYRMGDILTGNLLIAKISSTVIDVLDTKTNNNSQYLLG
jgi:hypothetical protein